jgi:hypothetical protein
MNRRGFLGSIALLGLNAALMKRTDWLIDSRDAGIEDDDDWDDTDDVYEPQPLPVMPKHIRLDGWRMYGTSEYHQHASGLLMRGDQPLVQLSCSTMGGIAIWCPSYYDAIIIPDCQLRQPKMIPGVTSQIIFTDMETHRPWVLSTDGGCLPCDARDSTVNARWA